MHTPGPWKVADVSFASGWDVVAPDMGGGAGPGETQTICDNLRAEDAALIAAAPELLSACRCAVAALSQQKTYRADVDLTIKVLSEAIAKAEGKQ